MRKIKNPYSPGENKCFACSSSNPAGLKLRFEEDDQHIYAVWEPHEYFQGYTNVIHGGIIATLLDEAAAWYVSVKLGTAGVTKSLNIEYIKPLYLTRGPVRVKASLTKKDERLATMVAELYDCKGTLCAKSSTVFFLYPEEVARTRFYYPGKEAF